MNIDKTTKEGRLLHAAILILKAEGPPEVKGKETSEILAIFDQTETAFENLKM